MQQNQTRDFLIRNMPIEIYNLLEQSAKEHKRSKTQEAIIVLSNGLNIGNTKIKKPTPYKWKKRVTSKFVEKAIRDGRE